MVNENKTPRGHGFDAADVAAIRKFMKDLDWTQERLAKESALSLPTIKLFLTGNRKLSAPASDRVMDALRAGRMAKNAADKTMRSELPRLTPEVAALIRAKAKAKMGKSDSPPLTFDQAGQIPYAKVRRTIQKEIFDSMRSFFALAGKTPEQIAETIEAMVEADERVKFAKAKFDLETAKAWIAHVEKERDDLKRELLKANEELLETYRRKDTLEQRKQLVTACE